MSTEDKSIEKLAYSIDEATKAAGLGRTTLYQAIKDGALVSSVVCGRRLLLVDDLKAFLQSGWNKPGVVRGWRGA